MWKGNDLISDIISRKFPWTVNPTKTFKWNVILSSIYNTVALFFIITLFYANIIQGPFHLREHLSAILVNTITSSLASFFIWGAMFLKRFFEGYKSYIQQEEQHKRELAIYQYEMLKNQVNPHFLFNSLNVLTSLVETDSESATKFIRKLAELYRYVLDVKDKELVPLSEELKIAEAYIFMQKNRFGDSLMVSNSVVANSKRIVPLALQMLIENAVKHNVISADRPLAIHIFEEDGFLVCENNLQKKTVLPSSNTIGLSNIKSRYAFLCPAPMEYGERDGAFVVRVPIL